MTDEERSRNARNLAGCMVVMVAAILACTAILVWFKGPDVVAVVATVAALVGLRDAIRVIKEERRREQWKVRTREWRERRHPKDHG